MSSAPWLQRTPTTSTSRRQAWEEELLILKEALTTPRTNGKAGRFIRPMLRE
jgi:hypothetical protein